VIEPSRALRYLHAPPNEANPDVLNASRSYAHRSLAFDELFFLQLGLALRRTAAGRVPGTAFPARRGSCRRCARRCRFVRPRHRTAPWRRSRPIWPSRIRCAALLQGDVGSGKTLVGLLAALTVVEQGHQAAFMAPTELLAEQHHATIASLVAPLGVRAELLTGAIRGRARCTVLEALASGEVAIVVGTQALIQEGVEFHRVGLAVVDEQHRFGVMQRAAWQRREGDGGALDVLVMSATPIPRTLALTLYGDLAVSTLDELPPGGRPSSPRCIVPAGARRCTAGCARKWRADTRPTWSIRWSRNRRRASCAPRPPWCASSARARSRDSVSPCCTDA
jgi:ATP-dependent DNA helicase RecG